VIDVSRTAHFLKLQTLKTFWGLELFSCSALGKICRLRMT